MNATPHPNLLQRRVNRRWCISGTAVAIVLFVLFAIVSGGRAKGASANRSSTATQYGGLMVYSGTDEFNDGGVLYYAHSSYDVYTSDGKLVATIANHLSRSDEIPEVATLPAGRYVIDARSESKGYVLRSIVIRPDRVTVVDLESR